MPYRKVRILSFFLEILSPKYSTTASLAISEGWNWKEVPGMPSHRTALLARMPSSLPYWLGPGRITSTSRMMDTYSSGFARARNRW